MRGEEGVVCDGCCTTKLSGRKFRCLVCSNYDLCAACFDRSCHKHPMQCLLTKKALTVYFGETSKNNRAQSLTCPLCGKMGFTAEELLSHSGSEHGDSHARVSCPVCVATRNPVHPPVTQHIVSHLQRDHSLGSRVRDIVALLEEPNAGRPIADRRNDFRPRFLENLWDVGLTADSDHPFTSLMNHIAERCEEVSAAIPRPPIKTVVASEKKSEVTLCSQDNSARFVSRNLLALKDDENDFVPAVDVRQFVSELVLASMNPNSVTDVTGPEDAEILLSSLTSAKNSK